MDEPSPASGNITRLLVQWRNGDRGALDQLTPLVYEQLKMIATKYMGTERQGHTIGATGLVHETYLRLVGAEVAWQDRVHFYAVAARIMRRILVDHARTAGRQRRGGGIRPLPLEEAALLTDSPGEEIIWLNDALDRLATLDQTKATIVDLILFGGLTLAEAAAALELSESSVFRQLRLAKAWLYQEIDSGHDT